MNAQTSGALAQNSLAEATASKLVQFTRPAQTQSELDKLLTAPMLDYSGLLDYISTWADRQAANYSDLRREVERSHNGLYKLIADGPYDFALRVLGEKDETRRKAMVSALSHTLVTRNALKRPVESMPDKTVVSAAIKVTFGADDRRLVHVYTAVCRKAADLGVKATDLPGWIKANHGIEKIRRGVVTKSLLDQKEQETALAEARAREQAEIARIQAEDEKLLDNVFARFRPTGMGEHFLDAQDQQQFVLLVTYMSDGQLAVNGVVKPDNSVVRLVRRAAFSTHKELLTREPLPPTTTPVKPAAEAA